MRRWAAIWRAAQHALGVAFVLLLLWYLWKVLWMPAIPPTQGDGVFETTSRRVFVVAAPSYRISMPEFDLGHPHQATYRVGGLTPLWPQSCGVFLAVIDTPGQEIFDPVVRGHERLGGLLEVSVTDSGGNSVVEVDGRLGEYRWGSRHDLGRLYKKDESFFSPQYAEEYRIDLKYTPDPRLAGRRGYLMIECGQ